MTHAGKTHHCWRWHRGFCHSYRPLRQRGCEVAVFEQAPELREIGVGLSVWPNATRVLSQFGLLPEILIAVRFLERLQVQFVFVLSTLLIIAALGQLLWSARLVQNRER
jgi:hypothetical protein